ncbi:hypothetical protein ENHY17A_50378 [Moraxellaceae bacterium 17A]|nr:hypothetical protein ENHY17A_50378 [Moraxellaceae bacterium 17A]
MSARGIEEIENGALDALGIKDGALVMLVNEVSIAVIKLILIKFPEKKQPTA